MCGIAGKIVIGGRVKQEDLENLSAAVAHRGLDDSGLVIINRGQVGLVNRRLAVQDLSPAGHQPMRRGEVWITFNGEVYNFGEIRNRLRQKGCRFKSGSDTEVILAGYELWGIQILERMRGQFALAIFDGQRQKLFLARDRLGEKPLKYVWDGKTLIFASELKSILTQPEITKKVNWLGVHQYLTFGYIPAPMTGFFGIFKLEPAHVIELDLSSGKLKKNRYWDLDYSQKLKLTEEEWGERLRLAFKEAVSLQMIADVPVGAFLSGGVDSSALVAMMAQSTNKKIKTFSIGFKEPSHDETAYAKTIADLYKTDHGVIRVNPTEIKDLFDMVGHFEELLANSSMLISYLVSRQARKAVTVVLSGDGGDENFTGYLKHEKLARDLWFEQYNNATSRLNGVGKWAMEMFKSGPMFKGARYLVASQMPYAERYVTYNCYLTHEDKQVLYTPAFKAESKKWPDYEVYSSLADGLKRFSPADRMLYADFFNYLPEDLLAKSDLASMAVALENRSPYLDHKFVELCAKIPFDLKVRGGQAKYIWKKALKGLVPRENMYRKKMGFSIPLSKWFDGDLGKLAKDRLLGRGFLLNEVIDQRSLVEYLKNRNSANAYELKLWAILYLQLWMERFFKS